MQPDSPMEYFGCHGLTADADNVLVYPANTYVRIVGNKRTQACLMGQEGRVIKTVGLGGWHWLELMDGTTVKVQRNALCLADDHGGYDYEEVSTPSDRSSTYGCSETSFNKALTSGGIRLHKLSTGALIRYVQFHGLDVGPRSSRLLLLKQVLWHFEASAMDEASLMTILQERCHEA